MKRYQAILIGAVIGAALNVVGHMDLEDAKKAEAARKEPLKPVRQHDAEWRKLEAESERLTGVKP